MSLVAAEEEVSVAIFEAFKAAIGRSGNKRSLRDRLDRNLNRRRDDLVAANNVAYRAKADVPADIADVNSARTRGLGRRGRWHTRRTTELVVRI